MVETINAFQSLWGRFTCFFFFKLLPIGDSVLISAVQQSDSVVTIYIYTYILFCYGLPQCIEYRSLRYTVGLVYSLCM